MTEVALDTRISDEQKENMLNIRDVLRNKEQQLEKLQREIDALRMSIEILEEEETAPAPKTMQAVGAGPQKHFP
jgi:prefoldin subunit 5